MLWLMFSENLKPQLEAVNTSVGIKGKKKNAQARDL